MSHNFVPRGRAILLHRAISGFRTNIPKCSNIYKLAVAGRLDISSVHSVSGIIGSPVIGIFASKLVNPAGLRYYGEIWDPEMVFVFTSTIPFALKG